MLGAIIGDIDHRQYRRGGVWGSGVDEGQSGILLG